MKALVTGGAGFIGSNLCDALVESGAEVIALDDLSVGKRSNLNPNVQFVQGDVRQPEAWSHLLHDVEVVYHLAVVCLRQSFEKPLHVHEVNATGTLQTLLACQQHARKLQRFVYCSSSEVYGSARHVPMDEHHPLNPTTVYGASKLAGEIYTLASPLPVTVARPFNTYGPREHHEGQSGEVIPRFAVRIANGLSPLIFGDGTQTRDFTHVSDTARGLMLLGTEPAALGQIFNLARGSEVSIAQIANLLLQKLGQAGLTTEFRPARPADVDRHYANVEKARTLLDFTASLDIEQGLDQYLEWFRRQHPEPHKLLGEVQEQNW